MSSVTVQQAFGRRALQQLAAGRSFERGVAYAEAGRVRNLEAGKHVVTARAKGSRTYRVRLWVGDGGPSFACDCPVGEEGSFCKHCVAVALELADGGGASAPGLAGTQKPLTDADVRRHLEGLGTAALVDLVMAQAENDELLRGRLLLDAAKAMSNGVDLRGLRHAIEKVIVVRDFVDYRSMYDYSRGIEDVLDSIQDLVEGHAPQVIELCEHALECLEDAMGRVDDSDGYMGSIRDRLVDLHHTACVVARPDPGALAARLFEWEMHSDWEIFLGAGASYADVLGEKGLATYRRLAEERWASVPALAPGDTREHSSSRFRITYAMEALARVSGDVNALVAVKSRDLSYAYNYVEIVNAYREAGRYEDALAWAERGLAAFPTHTDVRLREVLADEYHRCGRHDEAMALAWAELTEHPTLASYQRLEDHAQRAGGWEGW